MAQCNRCGTTDPAQFSPSKPTWCRSCLKAYRQELAAKHAGTAPLAVKRPAKVPTTEYIASRDLVHTWTAVIAKTDGHRRPANLMFVGPSGSGKTEGARFLAEKAGLAFTKVDAAAITEPEAWFGTREVVVENGAPKTVYRPSAFVEAIQVPGVLLVDEVNRLRDEQSKSILLPLLDSSGAVTNPLTGEPVVRDPRCIVILSGNIGYQYTGTFAIDPALWTRSLTVPFKYLDADEEERVVIGRTGAEASVVTILVRFANEVRRLATTDDDIQPMSTREVLAAAELVAFGLQPDLAVRVTVLNAASDEGEGQSPRAKLEYIWTGIAGR